jgi:hypothetical protein
MKTNTSRRLAPAVTAAALLAALTTGCSSEDPAPAKDDKPAAEQSTKDAAEQPAEEPAGVVLTEAQLKSALVTKADAKSYASEDNNAAPVRPKSATPECAPLADMTASGTGRTPQAEAAVSRSFGSETAPGLAVTIGLFSYEGKGAQQTLEGTRKAVAECAGGFSTSGNNGGATVKYSSVKGGQKPDAGDDAVSWVMTAEAQGQKVPMHFTVVREDSTVAVFFTIALSAPAKAELPQDLFGSQITKLTEHAGKVAG